MAGPLRVVHTPRQARLMRGDEEPFLRRPLIEKVEPYAPLPVVPWYDPGMGKLDLEYGASMDPRSNPAFVDSWVIGATGGANRVIPQGIDYSRTPCCVPNGLSGDGSLSVGPLFAGLVGIPLILLGMLLVGEAASSGQRPFTRRRNRAVGKLPGTKKRQGKPQVGDVVRYSRNFLRSIGAYTGRTPFAVGEITFVEDKKWGNGWYVKVLWDDEPEEAMGVLSLNLEIYQGEAARESNPTFARTGLLGLWDIYGPLHRDVYTQLVKLGRKGGNHIKVWEGVKIKHPHVDPWEVQVALEDLQREGAVSQAGDNWHGFTAMAAQGMR